MPALAASLVSLLREFRRRRVYRTGIAYVAAVFIVLQAADLLGAPLALPGWTMRLLVVLAVLGLPVALLLAWAFDITPEGVRRTPGAVLEVPSQPAAAATLSPPEMVAAGAVASAPAAPSAGGGSSNAEQPADVDARPGIVVLPFQNLSPDPGDAYFSDGLTEEIITMLSQLRGLRVISRSTAMVLKNTGKDVRTIGRDLGVGYLLEGSVRKAGDALRITAQLIDTRSDAHLWAERHDGTWSDIFDVQDRIATRIVTALRPTLAPTVEKLPAPAMTDPLAYAAYLRARQGMWEGTPESLRAAEAQMKAGLELVGPNAVFYAGLAYVHYQQVDFGYEGEAYIAKGDQAARRALELDPRSSEAHCVLGYMQMIFLGDQAGAYRHFRAALEGNPDNPDALMFLVFLEGIVGRMEDADDLVRRAQRVDPLNAMTPFWPAYLDTCRGRFGRAPESLMTWASLAPANPAAVLWSALLLCMQGHRAVARDLLVRQLQPTLPDTYTQLGKLLLTGLEHEGTGAPVTPSPALEWVYRADPVCSYMLAQISAIAGDPDGALAWLAHAMTRGFSNPALLAADEMLSGIRPMPEFARLMDQAREASSRFEI